MREHLRRLTHKASLAEARLLGSETELAREKQRADQDRRELGEVRARLEVEESRNASALSSQQEFETLKQQAATLVRFSSPFSCSTLFSFCYVLLCGVCACLSLGGLGCVLMSRGGYAVPVVSGLPHGLLHGGTLCQVLCQACLCYGMCYGKSACVCLLVHACIYARVHVHLVHTRVREQGMPGAAFPMLQRVCKHCKHCTL